MSPSWREALLVTLGAHELRVRRLSRGWRPRVLGEAQAPLNASNAEAAAQALAIALGQVRDVGAARPATAHVVLSSDWARFALLDGVAGLRGRSERNAAAAHALRRVYGAAADGWRLCHSVSGRDTLVAAGMDATLHPQLSAVLDAGGASLGSLRTAFGIAFTQCRRWLGQPSWFVCVEPGRATVGFSDGTQLRSLRSHRLRGGLDIELPAWLERARLVDGVAEADAAVLIAYRGAAPLAAAQVGASTRLVDLDAVPAAGGT